MQDPHYHSLRSESTLNHYKIIRILGAGGFGITYLAEDLQLSMQVVIKEYFPNEFAVRKNDSTIIAKTSSDEAFSKGLERFKEEAKTLAKFNHPSIVKILGYFEANQTGYFVMEYEEGIDLAAYLKQKGTLKQEEILSIMMPILEGLKEVHKNNYLHRDIKPGNILLRNNKSPVLIDFGASKLAIGEASKSITSMLTEGYAPLEQYSTNVKQQGPFTDLYAVGAVMYKMITGDVPPSAQTRSYDLLQDGDDPLKLLNLMKLIGYDENFLKAVDRALSLKAKDRPQNVQEFQKDIVGELHIEKEKVVFPPKNNKIKYILAVVILFSLFALYYYFNNILSSNINQEHSRPMSQSTHENKKLVEVNEEERKATAEKIKREKELKQQQEELATLRKEKAKAIETELAKLRKEKKERELLREKQNKLEKDKQEKIRLEEARQKTEREARIKREQEAQKHQERNLYAKTKRYHNNRFGFSLSYPANLLTKIEYPANGDGVWLSNEVGTVEVIPSAAFEFNAQNAKQMYREALAYKKQEKNIEITYKRQKKNWYVLSGYDHHKNIIFYEKYYLNNGVRSGFTITFPTNEKNKYKKLVTFVADSFSPSYGEN